MKTILLILGLCAALFASGCATGGPVADSSFIQTVLNNILPQDFEGDLKGTHDGFYFGTSVHLSVDLKGLRKEGGKWTWTSGGYKRDGFFSTGGIELIPKAK